MLVTERSQRSVMNSRDDIWDDYEVRAEVERQAGEPDEAADADRSQGESTQSEVENVTRELTPMRKAEAAIEWIKEMKGD
jgi:hypothetical protein